MKYPDHNTEYFNYNKSQSKADKDKAFKEHMKMLNAQQKINSMQNYSSFGGSKKSTSSKKK